MNLFLFINLEKMRIFDTLSNPIALMRRADMHVLHTDGTAVRLLQTIYNLAQRDLAGHVRQIFEETLISSRMHTLEVEFTIHILFGIEAVEAYGQCVCEAINKVGLGADVPRAVREGFVRVESKRIEVGRTMTIDLVCADEMGYTQ